MNDERKDSIAKEDDEMLIRYFVAGIGYDYIEHHEKHTSQIYPDFSERTIDLWNEIKSRLKGTTVLDFDREGAIGELREKGKQQSLLCETADHTSSYHYGLKSAYYEAIRIIEKHTRRAVDEEGSESE